MNRSCTIFLFLFISILSYDGISQDIQMPNPISDPEVKARFPGCEDIEENTKERQMCAEEKLIQFIYKNLKYPIKARRNKTQGNTYVEFVIEVDGFISNVKLKRDIGNGCGEAAMEVVKSMNDMDERWIPAMQNGEAVPMLFTLPVKFRLE